MRGMKTDRRTRLLLSLALFSSGVGLAALIRRPARALDCSIVTAQVSLDSVTVDGAPSSTAPYAGFQVLLFGEPDAVRLTASHPQMQGFYEETYHAPAPPRR
jgi:hypothetical protein